MYIYRYTFVWGQVHFSLYDHMNCVNVGIIMRVCVHPLINCEASCDVIILG